MEHVAESGDPRVPLRGHRGTGQRAHTERRHLLVPRGRTGADQRTGQPGGDHRAILGLLIWNDLSIVSNYLPVASDSGHVMSVAIERLLRRLITLIYAGRDRMVVIRRELPRTKRADPA